MALEFSCRTSNCSRSFDKEYKLCQHEEDRHHVHPGQVSCIPCNREFARRSSLLQHIEMNGIHNPNIPFVLKAERRSRRKGRRKQCHAKISQHTTDLNVSMIAAHPILHSFTGYDFKASSTNKALVEPALPRDSFLLTKDLSHLTRFVSEELAPTAPYNEILGKAMDELASYLKEKVSTLNVKETIKGGSAGKGTTVRNKSDLDTVIYLNDVCGDPDDNQSNLKTVLPQLEKELKKYHRVEVTGTTRFAVKIKLLLGGEANEDIDIDILPAFDFIDQYGLSEVYQIMKRSDSLKRRYFSSALSPLQVEFIKKRPPAVKNLIRLVKYWRKTHFKDRAAPRLPSSYQLELLTIHCWQEADEPEQFDLAQGFKVIMGKLTEPRNISCQWNDNYDIDSEFKDVISKMQKEAYDAKKPFILDPANPFNDIAAEVEAWDEVAKMARLSRQSMRDVVERNDWK